MKQIDLNCDVGEMPAAIADGTQEALLPFFTSANVACGGHAGDASTMLVTVRQAHRLGLAVGAHPSYPDREHFGRVALTMTPDALADSIYEQVTALAAIAAESGVRLTHVKPHGALYNQAAIDSAVAEAIARGLARWNRNVVLVGLAGSLALGVFRRAGFPIAGEAFANRRYEPDRTLRSRTFSDALIVSPEEAAQQALRIAERGAVIARDGSEIAVDAQTICVHSDSPGAEAIASEVMRMLRNSGVAIRALSPAPQ